MPQKCNSRIYCRGILLKTVQLANIFKDPKAFVDMPTLYPEHQVIDSFFALRDTSKASLMHFIQENFGVAGSDLKMHAPEDWKEEPEMLEKIQSKELQSMARYLNYLWKFLTRVFDHSWLCKGCVTTAFQLPFPFVIPGGRFRESYYWDSYWIFEGMMVSNMTATTKGMLKNFFFMVEKFGFVPNGSRTYYLNRSQPPLLSLMVDRFYEKTGDLAFVKYGLPFLVKEYQFWMSNRTVTAQNYKLNLYKSEERDPRPESYRQDYELGLQDYSDIIAATESGWDFSSRWLRNDTDLGTIRTSQIIPVDLNAILYKVERILGKFHGLFNVSNSFFEVSERRREAVDTLLFDKGCLCWRDYSLEEHTQIKKHFYFSNLSPLFYDLVNSTFKQQVLNKHSQFLLNYSGIPSSDFHSGQQWDFPNTWAPFHLFNFHNYSLQIAQKFVDTVYCGYNQTGFVFEKYDCEKMGRPGRGGEYLVQEGFGWTNGVVLKLLERFPRELKAPKSCPKLLVKIKEEAKIISQVYFFGFVGMLYLLWILKRTLIN